jgi:hypothetical protein
VPRQCEDKQGWWLSRKCRRQLPLVVVWEMHSPHPASKATSASVWRAYTPCVPVMEVQWLGYRWGVMVVGGCVMCLDNVRTSRLDATSQKEAFPRPKAAGTGGGVGSALPASGK